MKPEVGNKSSQIKITKFRGFASARGAAITIFCIWWTRVVKEFKERVIVRIKEHIIAIGEVEDCRLRGRLCLVQGELKGTNSKGQMREIRSFSLIFADFC